MTNNGENVLVVEDDPEINALVGAYAELCGFGYLAALTGEQAFRHLKTGTPALVMLDLMLPDVDGMEICRRLKSDEKTQNVPVIILTALGGEINRQRGLACGAADYMTKPFDPDQLMKAIARHAKTVGAAK
jgi:DNA-binding response OmpR family regulator